MKGLKLLKRSFRINILFFLNYFRVVDENLFNSFLFVKLLEKFDQQF